MPLCSRCHGDDPNCYVCQPGPPADDDEDTSEPLPTPDEMDEIDEIRDAYKRLTHH